MSYIGKSLTDVLLWAVASLMAVTAVWQFYLFVMFRDSQGLLDVQGGTLHLWLAIGGAAISSVCVFLSIFRQINKTEEFHITS